MAISSSNTSEAIYKILRSEILDLTIKPGEPLYENNLCARFAVSRTPVRSVLQRLRDGGLVTVVPYKGTFATLLNYDDIQQLIYMRVAVESMILRDYTKLATPIMLEKLRYIIRKQKVLLEGEFENAKFYELDSQLHETWFNACEKNMIWKAIQRAQTNYSRFRMLDIITENSFTEIVKEHEELFEIIEQKNFEALEDKIRYHLYGGIRRLEDKIKTEFSDYFQNADL